MLQCLERDAVIEFAALIGHEIMHRLRHHQFNPGRVNIGHLRIVDATFPARIRTEILLGLRDIIQAAAIETAKLKQRIAIRWLREVFFKPLEAHLMQAPTWATRK